ncbi:hypothetical protein PYK79_47270 [Streptomyces sp. ID05-04B]|uniref:hypothetical protein n=1 Tax=Streptomyces sp. ID05-04B TaxID=3028661 RepID=UPI0029C2D8C7|nr:hypothetical protein [Streptomyces sp. ID05-04B]MDX5569355.1 hypothetical protein [Streptomyces sp. ID05-04B]
MEKATQATTLTASTQTTEPVPLGSFEHAAAIAVNTFLPLEEKPFAVEITEDFPSGWRIHFKYRDSRVRGLFEFAAAVDVPVTRATTAFGVHFDAIARHEGLELHASALTSLFEAQALDDEIALVAAVSETIGSAQ